jgi:peptide/nickel transport system substrate-binding protein
LRNYATAANGLLTPDSPFHSEQIPLPKYDPTAASQLLDELGYPRKLDGSRLTLSLKTTTDLTRLIVAKAIAQQLGKIGVLVKVESLEWSRFKKDVDQGSVELWTLSWIGFKDPDILRHAFGSESFPPQGGNRGRYSSPKLDELLKRGVSDFSLENRKEIYLQAQKLIAEELPYAMLWHEDRIVVASERVQGFVPFADGRYRGLGQTWLAQP